MSPLDELVPRPPEWIVDWNAIDAAFQWIRRLRECPQDPRHHREGDVWTHTRLVCEALASLASFRALAEDERAVLFTAALLHDVAKPQCTRREDDGSITSRGHARRGEIASRAILWRLGLPFREREHAVALVRHHALPFVLTDRDPVERSVIEASVTSRCAWLAILAEADARGRACDDLGDLLDRIALFRDACDDLGCLDRPFPFESDHSRFVYFRKADCRVPYAAHDDSRNEVILMSGLPAAGKDHWIDHHGPGWEVVSLDRIRRSLRVRPEEPQGVVVARAREIARDHLRRGTPFIWNATNVSRDVRRPLIDLFASYRARVRIVYVEASEERLLEQNRERPDPVPESVISALVERRWQVPDLTEAHSVEHRT